MTRRSPRSMDGRARIIGRVCRRGRGAAYIVSSKRTGGVEWACFSGPSVDLKGDYIEHSAVLAPFPPLLHAGGGRWQAAGNALSPIPLAFLLPVHPRVCGERTQQFNTTTSMGRLTLNVLLSFTQFEREVTGERIRDKVAASKKALAALWSGIPVQRCTVHKHRNLLAHAPDRLHEEISADYKDMIYAGMKQAIEAKRKAFIRK